MTKSEFQQRLQRFFALPATDAAISILILLSVILLAMESSYAPESRQEILLEWVQLGITAIFVVELALRAWAIGAIRRFLAEYWVDVLAVLPVIRPLRLLRLLRLARLVRVGIIFTRRGRRLASMIHEGMLENMMVMGVLVAFVLLGTVGMMLAERGKPGFSSFDDSFWWSLFSLMSGEPIGATPSTTVGRLITAVVMVAGFTLFAMFTGVISAVMVTRLRNQWEARDMELMELRNHIIICGYNRSAITIIAELQRDEKTRSTPIVLVAELEQAPSFAALGLRPETLYFVRGDYTSTAVLQKAGIERAAATVLLADKSVPRPDQDRDARTLLAALTIEKLRPGIFTCAELLRRENIEHLSMAKVEEIIIGDEYMGHLIAHSSRARGIIKVMDELLTASMGNQFYKISVPASLVGKTFFDAFVQIKSEQDAIAMAVETTKEDGKRVIHTNPPGDFPLRHGDELLVICQRDPAVS